MTAPIDVIEVALRVAAAIELAGGTYFVGGSLASSFQGEPRSTNDIDFVIELPPERVSALKSELGVDFEVDEEMVREALRRATCANVFYLPWVLKIDLFGRGHAPYDEAEFSRRNRVVVRDDGSSLFMKTAEDTVLRKLWWFREGGEVSDRQWRDVQGVLRAHAEGLDDAYMDRWANTLGVRALLEQARRQATE